MNTNGHELERLDSLYGDIRTVLEQARSAAYRAVNFAMVRAYWQIGCLIVESEQKGQERAEYGKAVLKELSQRLTREFGKGYSIQSLRNMRQFYMTFSKRSALRSESLDSTQLASSQCKQIFASKYMLYLPTEEELRRELERERKLIEETSRSENEND